MSEPNYREALTPEEEQMLLNLRTRLRDMRQEYLEAQAYLYEFETELKQKYENGVKHERS